MINCPLGLYAIAPKPRASHWGVRSYPPADGFPPPWRTHGRQDHTRARKRRGVSCHFPRVRLKTKSGAVALRFSHRSEPVARQPRELSCHNLARIVCRATSATRRRVGEHRNAVAIWTPHVPCTPMWATNQRLRVSTMSYLCHTLTPSPC